MLFQAIREDPAAAEKKEYEVTEEDRKYKKKAKLTYDERKAAVAAKKVLHTLSKRVITACAKVSI